MWYKKAILTYQTVKQTLDCDRFAEGYSARLSCSIVYHAVQTNFNFTFCKQNLCVNHSSESLRTAIP